MKVILDPEVHSDLFEILDYYEENAGSSIAADLYLEFRRIIKIVGERPYAFPLLCKELSPRQSATISTSHPVQDR